MARIAGVDLPRQKHINIALTYIYGIGNPRAVRILDEAKVDAMKKVQDLSEEEVNRFRTVSEAEGLVGAVMDRDTLVLIGLPREKAKELPMTPDNTDHLLLDKPLWVTRDGVELA